MRLKATYRTERRNATGKNEKKRRALNKDFARLSGGNWKLPFPTTKKDPVSGLDMDFITRKSPKARTGKSYPYRSVRRGGTGQVVTLSW